jgi:S-adenosylmethionine:tRNA ribosyltransferase-isomerase
VNLSDFQYELPAELIAQFPAERRDAARLLVHSIESNNTEWSRVSGIGHWLRPGDLLVVNDTKVLPARLHGRRSTGGAVEFLFTEPGTNGAWRAMARPAKKLKPGELIEIAGGKLRVRMIERVLDADGKPGALWMLAVEQTEHATGVEAMLEEHGELPLPPYIERHGSEGPGEQDAERYQTVYAQHNGAVAAPTAGLHFTKELLADLASAGIQSAPVTLHVGLGTFLPVAVENVEDHQMHSERFVLPESTVEAVSRCREGGGRVIAVGTTSVRVLESCAEADGSLQAGSGRTEIFIRPGYEFRCVDGLLTNFHLPGSTLLMLISALAGTERVRELYRQAIDERMRFYSYGDAMLLLR